jgi:hypothetical protein
LVSKLCKRLGFKRHLCGARIERQVGSKKLVFTLPAHAEEKTQRDDDSSETRLSVGGGMNIISGASGLMRNAFTLAINPRMGDCHQIAEGGRRFLPKIARYRTRCSFVVGAKTYRPTSQLLPSPRQA